MIASRSLSRRTPRQVSARSSSRLNNLSIPQRLLLSGLLLGLPLTAAGGVLGNLYWQEAQLARRQVASAMALAPLQALQLELRTMRGYQAAEVPRSTLQNAEDSARQLAELTRRSPVPNIQALGAQVERDTLTLTQRVRQGNVSAQGILDLTAGVLYGPQQELFSALAHEGELLQAASEQASDLANLTTEVMPTVLPRLGGAFGGALVQVSDINRTQGGQVSPVQAVQLSNQLQRGEELTNDLATRLERFLEENPDLRGELTPIYTQAVNDTKYAFKVARSGSVEAGGKTRVDAARLIEVSDKYLASQYKAFASTVEIMNRAFAAQERASLTRFYALVGAFLLALLLLGLLLRGIARSITAPLGFLTQAAQQLSQGQLNVRVPAGGRDELGQLARSLNLAAAALEQNAQESERQLTESRELQRNIGGFLDVTMDIADGDLTKRGVVTEDVLGNVVDSVNLMAQELGETLRGVRETSDSVRGGSQAMLGTTAVIEEGTQVTAAEARRVAAQVASITAAVREMAREAQASAQAAEQALLASQQGQQAVEQTLSGMQAVRSEVQTVTRRARVLGERSREIQEVVDTIAAIARRTNLLALNAAVEAAGAGELGGRFSAVAEEIRALAATSATATTRVATLIRSVQAEVEDVMTGAEEGYREVQEGYSVAETAGERLRELGELSQRAAQSARAIAQVTEQQVQGVEQVSGAVQEIAGIAQRSEESVRRGRDVAQQLQELANDLERSLSRFRLPA